MAAVDTFEWFAAMISRDAGPELVRFVNEERACLYSLRSEDERQRFVDELVISYRKAAGIRKK